MTEQLKTCAHCGKNPELKDENLNGYYLYFVDCNCGMQTSFYVNKQQAVNIWNTRIEKGCDHEWSEKQ